MQRAVRRAAASRGAARREGRCRRASQASQSSGLVRACGDSWTSCWCRTMVHRLLDELAADLQARRYRPLPARRVFIPKPGSGEWRPLSIPTVRDRIVQAACKIVCENVSYRYMTQKP